LAWPPIGGWACKLATKPLVKMDFGCVTSFMR
jgi:hypothetical protein